MTGGLNVEKRLIPSRKWVSGAQSKHLSVSERLSWMNGRETTREEDTSYALYGIFNVTPGANYGEGQMQEG